MWLGRLAGGRARAAGGSSQRRPNILWIMAEDIGPDLGCYGVKAVSTPNLDRLAAQGARYNNAFCTAPVCSPSRSAMMTGMYQDAIGANQHRTANKKPLPDGVHPITYYLRKAGYFTAIGCGYSAKTDLNFKTAQKLFDGRDWNQRRPGQPFFAQLTITNTHRPWHHDELHPVDPAKVEVPPYYPDCPLVRRDWANGLEEIQRMDRTVGKILKRLDDEGIADETLVFFIGDNGRCLIRGKQFLYDGGIHVSLLVRWPGKIKPGTVSDEMVSTIDISAAVLAAAGCELPDHLQGRDFLDPAVPRRKYIFAARDKMDNTHDSMRAVRSRDFKYILNLMPERAWCQFNEYKERQYPVLALMNVLHMEGKLTPVQDRFMQPHKPKEELYDLRKDPYEVHNVAGDPNYAGVLREMRSQLAAWRKLVGDKGVTEEFRKGGWPATYPTKSLEEWKAVLKKWEDHLFRGGPPPGGRARKGGKNKKAGPNRRKKPV
ncbi:MAG: sulfatase [Planctomycetes bacterium]|nr:sulfatase [Planctomycetota bacterium]